MNKRWPHHGKYKYHVTRQFKKDAEVSEPPDDIVQFFREKQRKETRMDTLVELIKDSTIVQGMITLACVGVTCYLWATGQDVPQELWTTTGVILGYFFGAKTWRAKK